MTAQQKTDIALIGAMAEEIQAFIPYLDECQVFQNAHTPYYTGRLHQKSILISQSGLGKVNAALTAAQVIEHFAPKYIINIGSAGGLHEQLCVGDVVISSSAFYHDVDVTLLNCVYGQIPGIPKNFPAHPELIAFAQKAVNNVTNLRAIVGSIGSGDTFMSAPAHVQLVRQRFPEMIAVDMEAAAIAHTCYIYKTPFVIIRAISDVVGEVENKVDFFTFLKTAAKHSAQTVANMIASIEV